MLDARYWILDAGYWILDAGYWILDTRCWMLDACSLFRVPRFFILLIICN